MRTNSIKQFSLRLFIFFHVPIRNVMLGTGKKVSLFISPCEFFNRETNNAKSTIRYGAALGLRNLNISWSHCPLTVYKRVDVCKGHRHFERDRTRVVVEALPSVENRLSYLIKFIWSHVKVRSLPAVTLHKSVYLLEKEWEKKTKNIRDILRSISPYCSNSYNLKDTEFELEEHRTWRTRQKKPTDLYISSNINRFIVWLDTSFKKPLWYEAFFVENNLRSYLRKTG